MLHKLLCGSLRFCSGDSGLSAGMRELGSQCKAWAHHPHCLLPALARRPWLSSILLLHFNSDDDDGVFIEHAGISLGPTIVGDLPAQFPTA